MILSVPSLKDFSMVFFSGCFQGVDRGTSSSLVHIFCLVTFGIKLDTCVLSMQKGPMDTSPVGGGGIRPKGICVCLRKMIPGMV